MALPIKKSASPYALYFRIIFLYTKLAFVSQLLEDFYIVHEHIDALCFFLLQKDFCIVQDQIIVFCFYLLQKDFDIFHKSFFEAFLCFSDNIHLTFFIYRKKIIEKCFIAFLKLHKSDKLHKSYKSYKLYNSYQIFYELLKNHL